MTMKLTNQQQQHLAAWGSFLQERLAGLTAPSGRRDGARRQELFDEWQRKAGGNGGAAAFRRWLEAAGITAAAAQGAVDEPVWPPDTAVPDWTVSVAFLCGQLPYRPIAAVDNYLGEEATVWQGWMTVLLPVIRWAEGELDGLLGEGKRLFTFQARAQMSAALATVLRDLSFPTLEGEFRQDWARREPLAFLLNRGGGAPAAWRQFVSHLLDGGWRRIWLDYPVLARLMVMVSRQWMNHCSEVAHRLEQDQTRLADFLGTDWPLGMVTGWEACIADSHNHGRSVCLLTFDGGRRLVYKPRSLLIDEAWWAFLEWFGNDETVRDLQAARVMDCGEYGWMEYIAHQPLADIDEAPLFYRRAGLLLGLLYVLGGNDFHKENLIACGSRPYLIDNETLLLHRVRPFGLDEGGLDANQQAFDILSDSVLRTGFLPVWLPDKQGGSSDVSALSGDGGLNLPRLDGRTVRAADYQDDLLTGFTDAYDSLLRRRAELLGEASPLALFAAGRFRYLIRSSQIYGELLTHTARPEYLRDGLLYSLEVERLAPAFHLHAPAEVLPELWPMYRSERDALCRRDIPLFYGQAGEIAVRDETGIVYDRYFLQTALDRANELAGRLSNADKTIQTGLVAAALNMQDQTPHEPDASGSQAPIMRTEPQTVTPDFTAEAVQIYDRIISQAITDYQGGMTWIARQYDMATQRLILGRIGWAFYDGLLGMGVFMAALYAHTGRTDIRDNAWRTVAALRSALYDGGNPLPIRRLPVGLASGVGGMARALAVMSGYLADSSLLTDAIFVLHQVQDSHIDGDTALDVIGGSAGLLLVVSDLCRQTGDERLLAIADRCGQKLLAARIQSSSGHRVWQGAADKQLLTGMGHGAAGIAWALMKLYALTGDSTYRDGALEAIAWENTLFDYDAGNWPDRRTNPRIAPGQKVYMSGWCSGAPGTGLARLGCMTVHDNETIRRDVEAAMAYSLANGLLVRDHLCCGNASHIEWLLEAGLHLERHDLLAAARDRMLAVLNRKDRYGGYCCSADSQGSLIANPSFFQGTSGIGYQLLRLTDPARFPGVVR